MKTRQLLSILTILSSLSFASISYAADIVASGSGNWSSTVTNAPWPDGIVPSTNDTVEIEWPYVVTVDTNTACSAIYSSFTPGGTVTLAPGVTLEVFDPSGGIGTQSLGLLDATATGCTVNYHCNPFWAKRTDYYNLIFSCPAATRTDFYNGAIPGYPAAPMHIAGDMTISGTNIKVQQGADISIGGSLKILGATNTWDCSVANLTVRSNTFLLGTNDLLLDLDGAGGSNYFGGNMTISSSALAWNLTDVTTWGVGGSLTNEGLIAGKGYGSISFEGTGYITGTPLKIPTLTINGTYTIGTTITLITNTPTLNGTLVFDIANPKQIVLLTNAGTALYYSGNLNVINSGAPPASGAHYQFFNCTNGFGGGFTSTSFPSLPDGLSWIDNTLTAGSIDVAGAAGSPVLAVSINGGLLTLSWDSATYPGYQVLAQTNGLGSNWSPAGSGTVSPFVIPIDPASGAVFFRLSNP